MVDQHQTPLQQSAIQCTQTHVTTGLGGRGGRGGLGTVDQLDVAVPGQEEMQQVSS